MSQVLTLEIVFIVSTAKPKDHLSECDIFLRVDYPVFEVDQTATPEQLIHTLIHHPPPIAAIPSKY